jgi:hypothetical protein
LQDRPIVAQGRGPPPKAKREDAPQKCDMVRSSYGWCHAPAGLLCESMSRELLVNAFVVGAAALALWLWTRLGDRKPESLKLVLVHLALAVVVLGLMPIGISEVIGDAPSAGLAALGLFGLFLPTMTYVMLCALWFFERLNHSLHMR